MDVNTLEVTRDRSFMDSMCKGLEMGESDLFKKERQVWLEAQERRKTT